MSRFVRPFLVLLIFLMIVFLILGAQGTLRQKQLKADLAGQTTIALHLKTLREAAEAEGKDTLVVALNESLAQLAPAASDLAEPTVAGPLTQQLDISIDALVKFGLETKSIAERAKALTAVTRIWTVARNEEITDNEYPAALAQQMSTMEDYTCAEPQEEAPKPSSAVAHMQSTLYQLNYVSELYTARSESGYEPVRERARTLAQNSAALRDTVTPLLMCEQRFEAIQPVYPTVVPEQAEKQLDDLVTALADSSVAVLSDPAVGTDEDMLEVIALALALRPF